MADADEEDLLALGNQLCFSLYAASRALTRLYQDLLADLGLTYPQYLVMLVLWEHGTLTVKEMGRALRLDSGTLSPLLRRMESLGLLERHRGAADERVVQVTATEAGTRLRERAGDIPERLLCAADMPKGRARELGDTLDQLTRSVEAATGGRDGGTRVSRT